MAHSTSEPRLLRHRRSLKARFGNFPDSSGGASPDVNNNASSDTTGTGVNDPNANDSGGSDALNQLLSSQAAQFSATAFNNLPTGTGSESALPTGDPSLDSSSDSATASDGLPTSATVSAAPTQTDPTINMSGNGNTITALPSVTAASAINTQSSSNTGSSHNSSHSAAIGVTVTFLIIGLCVVAFHFIRKRQIAKREARRATWNPPLFNPGGAGDGSDMENGEKPGQEFETIDINEKHGPQILPDNVVYPSLPPKSPPHPASAFSMPAAPPPLHPTGYAPPRMPSPPPIATAIAEQNRAAPSPVGIDAPAFPGNQAPLVSSTAFAPVAPVAPLNVPRESVRSLTKAPPVGLGLPAQLTAGALVIVARTFVPSLPDELPIQTGEQVRIVTKYDDGWAHVERMRSGAGVESGVVPLECLEAPTLASVSVPGMGLPQIAVESWRLSKRASSLRGADSPIQRM